MENTFEQIREQQKESWNQFSPGWEKWDNLFMSFLKPMGNEIIRQLHLRDTDLVLDVASGTGEPGLTIASGMEHGTVILTDLSENMLEIAERNAKNRGVGNIRTFVGEASKLPFPDNTFDAISCRLGFMFFPNMMLAAKEMLRVLKPGGRISTSVWNVPAKNFWVTAMMEPINRNMNLMPPPEGAPGVFRCAKEGFMQDLLLWAGFKNISVKELDTKFNFKTTDTYWDLMTEVAAPVVEALNKADKETREKIKTEVYQSVNQKYSNGNVAMNSSAWIIGAEK